MLLIDCLLVNFFRIAIDQYYRAEVVATVVVDATVPVAVPVTAAAAISDKDFLMFASNSFEDVGGLVVVGAVFIES